jgi:X-X-X-Leu-X-X-Gly heptad repeat protein
VFGDKNWNDGVESMKEYNKLFKEHLKRESKEKTVTDGVKQVTNGVKQATDGVKQATDGVKQVTDAVEQANKVNNSVKRALFMYKTYSFLNFVSSASSAESAINLGYNLVKGIVLDPL